MMFFGTSKKPDPVESARKWKRELQKEIRKLDRELANFKREETKAMKECKKLAKEGRQAAVRIMAKQIVSIRRAEDRLRMAQAQMNSVALHIQTTMAMNKMQGCLKMSSDVMKSMNSLVKIPELQKSMNEMMREMEKAGMIDEIVGDAMDSMDPEGIESEVDLEVDKVLEEIAADVLSKAASAPVGVPVAAVAEEASANKGEEDPEEVIRRMQERLQSL